jgi:hypothetical protein
MYNLLAFLILTIHLIFILFVLLGGLLALRWPLAPWLHIPCAIWGVLIELRGWICPLTPLENTLRRAGGGDGYSEGFIEHYLIKLIYPPGLTPGIQIGLAITVLLVNLAIYVFVWWHWQGRGG